LIIRVSDAGSIAECVASRTLFQSDAPRSHRDQLPTSCVSFKRRLRSEASDKEIVQTESILGLIRFLTKAYQFSMTKDLCHSIVTLSSEYRLT
jgi:hypothetical protein